MNATPPEAQGQTIRLVDIPISFDAELSSCPGSPESGDLPTDLEVVTTSLEAVRQPRFPVDKALTIGEMLGAGNHLRHCKGYNQPAPFDPGKPSTSTAPQCLSRHCTCKDLRNILIYPEDLIYDFASFGNIENAHIDADLNLRRRCKGHFGEEGRPLLLRACSDVDIGSCLMDPTDVDAMETRIQDSKDVSTSGQEELERTRKKLARQLLAKKFSSGEFQDQDS